MPVNPELADGPGTKARPGRLLKGQTDGHEHGLARDAASAGQQAFNERAV
ncbi:MAG TPA: hypothetical protein VHX16_09230 [Chloroflexota bacterium]|nr:hypothetical protein [Chloroflexota bacterium]